MGKKQKLLVLNFKDILLKKPLAKYCMMCTKRAGLIKKLPQSTKPIYIRKNITKEITITIDDNSVIWDLMREYYRTDGEEEQERLLYKASTLLIKRMEDEIYG